jgi:hypothetical protein
LLVFFDRAFDVLVKTPRIWMPRAKAFKPDAAAFAFFKDFFGNRKAEFIARKDLLDVVAEVAFVLFKKRRL